MILLKVTAVVYLKSHNWLFKMRDVYFFMLKYLDEMVKSLCLFYLICCFTSTVDNGQ